MVNKTNLDNLTKGSRPALHGADPNWGDIVDVSEDQVITAIADAQALLADVQRIFPKTKP